MREQYGNGRGWTGTGAGAFTDERSPGAYTAEMGTVFGPGRLGQPDTVDKCAWGR